MTSEDLDNMKYWVCCPICDNNKCVKGTDKCEAEIWKRRKLGGEDEIEEDEGHTELGGKQ